TFSVNSIIKSTLSTINNVLSASMPNDVSVWSSFYINVAETYDQSDGTTVSTFLSSFTEDGSTGYAVNASMPFKSRYSSFLSEYEVEGPTRKFMTDFIRPVLFGGCGDNDDCYQDITVLLERNEYTYVLKQTLYRNGVIYDTVFLSIARRGEGIYRVPIHNNVPCLVDTMEITLLVTSVVVPPVSTFINAPGSDWTVGSNPTRVFGGFQSSTLRLNFQYVSNVTYNFKIRISRTQSAQVTVQFRRANNSVISASTPVTASGSGTSDVIATITGGSEIPAYVALSVNNLSGSSNTVTILDMDVDSMSQFVNSETKVFTVDCDCNKYNLKLTWLNNLGGWEYWNFTAGKDYQIDIAGVEVVKQNILGGWPQSYGEFADTIERDISRVSKNQVIVRSQNLTRDEVTAISKIKTSALVQIIDSKYNRRTVRVDSQSFKIYAEVDKLYTISFTITYTDDLPVQSV
ncbi:MAG TPA: hypothetical protein VHL77_01905, partial [Ferruginibacter sp.]|nr:hypothetical protein [Ferruginibacter sp.]